MTVTRRDFLKYCVASAGVLGLSAFDPCLDCAAYAMRPGREAKVIRIGA